MDLFDKLQSCGGFDWDKDNLVKNWEKHQVAFWECEEVFFNQPLLLMDDLKHSTTEERFYALGKSDGGRCLFVVFTVRHRRLRVISARDMSRKERMVFKYEQEKDTRF